MASNIQTGNKMFFFIEALIEVDHLNISVFF
jgi:hypothetical protein